MSPLLHLHQSKLITHPCRNLTLTNCRDFTAGWFDTHPASAERHEHVRYIFLCLYVCMYLFKYVCVYVYMFVCIYECMYVCIYECMYVWLARCDVLVDLTEIMETN